MKKLALNHLRVCIDYRLFSIIIYGVLTNLKNFNYRFYQNTFFFFSWWNKSAIFIYHCQRFTEYPSFVWHQCTKMDLLKDDGATFMCTPPETTEVTYQLSLNLLPEKSRIKYERIYFPTIYLMQVENIVYLEKVLH